jgi:hypothetical protein
MQRVLPGRTAVELDDSSPIFHSVYDLDKRYQVPGARYLSTGVTEKCEGCPPYWRGILGQQGPNHVRPHHGLGSGGLMGMG